MADTPVILNHHAGVVLPYHQFPNGQVKFLFELKSDGYKDPWYHNALNFLGGMWKKGLSKDTSPEATAIREIREEFRIQEVHGEDGTNALLGQDYREEVKSGKTYNREAIEQIQEAGRLLTQGLEHRMDFMVTDNPPVTKAPLPYGVTVFTKKLSRDEYYTLDGLLSEFSGFVTPDNVDYRSKTVMLTLDEINEHGIKWANGYDHIINHILASGVFPQLTGVFRPFERIQVEPIICTRETSTATSPTYHDFKASGYEYTKHKAPRP